MIYIQKSLTAFCSLLNEIVDKAVLGITAIMGVGLVIFGVKWIVGQLKDFFMMISGDSGGSGGDH